MKTRIFFTVLLLGLLGGVFPIPIPSLPIAQSQDLTLTPITIENAALVNPIAVVPDSTGMASVSFSPESHWIVSWNGADQFSSWTLDLEGYTSAPSTSSIAFSQVEDAKFIYARGVGIETGFPNGHASLIADAHEDTVSTVAVSPDASLIATASLDNTVRVWQWGDPEPLITLPGYDGAASQLVFNPDSTMLVSTNPAFNEIRLWQTRQTDNLQISMAGQAPVRFSPDGTRLAFVDVNNTVTVKGVEEIITERSQSVFATLIGHRDAILDFAWSPDGNLIATASRDNTLSVWNAHTGEELRILIGHTRAVNRVQFTPDGQLLISASLDGTVRLWEVGTGQELATLQSSPISDMALSPDGSLIVTSSLDGPAILWGIGPAVEVSVINVALPNAEPQIFTTSGIAGIARQPLSAGVHPDNATGCTIAEDEAVLAVARTEASAVLAYAAGPSCEGAVWIAPANVRIIWADMATLNDLPVITVADPPPLMRLVNAAYAEVCANASGQVRLTNENLPYTAYPPDSLPKDVQATLAMGIDVIICHEYPTTPIENCHYLGPGNYSYIFTRLRTDDLVTLVDYATGQVIGRQKFNGGPPPLCPNTTTRGEVSGSLPIPEQWTPWVLSVLYGSNAPAARTTVASGTLNARSLPTTESEILAQLSRGTPVNLIGRNAAGDWVLALILHTPSEEDTVSTPFLTQAWLFVDLLQVAPQTDLNSLPVADGPANTIEIQVTSLSIESAS